MSNESRVKLINEHKEMIGGLLSGVTSSFICHPLDLVKIRLQVNKSNTNSWTIFTFQIRDIFRKTGFRGFYQGVSANVIASGVAWATYFCVFKQIDSLMKARCNSRVVSEWTGAMNLLSATLSGFTTLVLTNSLFVVKVRMCLQNNAQNISLPNQHYNNIIDGLYKIWKYEGFKGLMRGFTPGIFGVGQWSIMYSLYLKIKGLMQAKFKRELNTADHVVATCISKSISTIITYPFIILRTRSMQLNENSNTNLFQLFYNTYKEKGLISFYRGIIPGIIRVLPSTCITIATYEYIIKSINTMKI